MDPCDHCVNKTHICATKDSSLRIILFWGHISRPNHGLSLPLALGTLTHLALVDPCDHCVNETHICATKDSSLRIILFWGHISRPNHGLSLPLALGTLGTRLLINIRILNRKLRFCLQRIRRSRFCLDWSANYKKHDLLDKIRSQAAQT